MKPLLAVTTERYDGSMADIWVIVTVIGFFAACVALVWGCDRIIGPDDEFDLDDASEAETFPAEAIR